MMRPTGPVNMSSRLAICTQRLGSISMRPIWKRERVGDGDRRDIGDRDAKTDNERGKQTIIEHRRNRQRGRGRQR